MKLYSPQSIGREKGAPQISELELSELTYGELKTVLQNLGYDLRRVRVFTALSPDKDKVEGSLILGENEKLTYFISRFQAIGQGYVVPQKAKAQSGCFLQINPSLNQ